MAIWRLRLGFGRRDIRGALLSHDAGDIESLRSELCAKLRDRSIPLDRPGRAEHLRETVVNQASIDVPRYSGLRNALAAGGHAA